MVLLVGCLVPLPVLVVQAGFAAALPGCILNRSAPGGKEEEADSEEAAPECGPLGGMSSLAPRLVVQAAFAAALPGCVLNRSDPGGEEEEKERHIEEASPEYGPLLGGMSCLVPSPEVHALPQPCPTVY